MQAIQFTRPEEINLIDLPEPSLPGPGEALVRTHRMGICGTDLSGYLGKMPFFSYPRIPGHELGLEVLAVGDGVSNIRPGDKASLEPYVNDPASPTSLKGSSNCCPGVQVLGVHTDGGLRDSWIVPARKLHPGNHLSYDQLALVETLAIGYHAVQRGNPQPGETVLVIGAGPIGLACLEFLKLMDVRVVIMDMVQGRLDFVREKLGLSNGILVRGDGSGSELAELEALTGGQLADVIIDATGSAASMSTCFQYAAFTGRVVYVGITTQELKFPHAPVFHRRELTLLASRNALPKDFGEIIKLIGEGKIDTDAWITHRLPFAEVPTGFAKFTDPKLGAIKVIIDL
ncbi:zinc-binding alcohol dehydrogenase family protein [Haloferula sp. BvORR071]|uniref:zinc-binding alcohol dehydrogenase family protein n=1 Tax=Haloferula sp. BvORR071 TaxID=1396141 RepID=UPI0005572807|nr:zinc-binding alcohol dehydrogenase family protein [Haloferula sp. BvORR071]